jgi:UTP--glucose-1-phosphate uridylyltransferase
MGRYVLTPTIWEYLDGEKIGAKGEIQLTDALDQMARAQGITGFEASGKKIDIGNQKGWLEANIYYAIREYGQEWVEKLVEVNSISKGKTE